MIQYPVELPKDAISNLIQMISTRTFEKDVFALSLWNLQGYAQSKIAPLSGLSGRPVPSDQEALDALRDLNQIEDTEGLSGFSEIALGVILKWALNKAISLL